MPVCQGAHAQLLGRRPQRARATATAADDRAGCPALGLAGGGKPAGSCRLLPLESGPDRAAHPAAERGRVGAAARAGARGSTGLAGGPRQYQPGPLRLFLSCGYLSAGQLLRSGGQRLAVDQHRHRRLRGVRGASALRRLLHPHLRWQAHPHQGRQLDKHWQRGAQVLPLRLPPPLLPACGLPLSGLPLSGSHHSESLRNRHPGRPIPGLPVRSDPLRGGQLRQDPGRSGRRAVRQPPAGAGHRLRHRPRQLRAGPPLPARGRGGLLGPFHRRGARTRQSGQLPLCPAPGGGAGGVLRGTPLPP
ncbi:hypothetical protein D3C79_715740 [compost metagenome]